MKRMKAIAKWAGIALVVLFLLAAIVLLLIPVAPLENLASAQTVAPSESQFVTIPFDGTDGIDIHYLADEAAEDWVLAISLRRYTLRAPEMSRFPIHFTNFWAFCVYSYPQWLN
jgi:hypothetical protein